MGRCANLRMSVRFMQKLQPVWWKHPPNLQFGLFWRAYLDESIWMIIAPESSDQQEINAPFADLLGGVGIQIGIGHQRVNRLQRDDLHQS